MTVKQLTFRFCLVIFTFWFAAGLPMALIVLIMQERGLDLFQVALCFAVYGLTAAVLEVPTGGIADVFGRRNATLIAYISMILGGALYLVSFSMGMFFLAMVFAGAGRAFLSGSMIAWFVDAALAIDEKANLQKSFAQIGIAQLVAMSLGLLAGSAWPQLYTRLGIELHPRLTPMTSVLVVALAAWAVALAFFLVIVRESRPEDEEPWGRLKKVFPLMRDSVLFCVQNRGVALLLVPAICWGVALGVLESFWQPRFAALIPNFESETYWFGILYAGCIGISALGNLLAAGISNTVQRDIPLVCALTNGLRLLAITLLALQTNVFVAAAFFWLIYFASGVSQSPEAALFNMKIPSERRATLISISSLLMAFGGAMGNSALGYVAKSVSVPAAWLLGGSFLFISILAYLAFRRREMRIQMAQGEVGVA